MTDKSVTQPSLIKDLLIGYCLGTANIIPGVSGGTFLLIFNIYERVFDIISRINHSNLIAGFSLMINLIKRPGKGSFDQVHLFLQTGDFVFLIRLILGAAVAIISLSSLMKYLIVYHFEVTYALFLGLILFSIVIPVKMLQHKKIWLLIFILMGTMSTVYITAAVNPYDKAKIKSDIYQKSYKAGMSYSTNTGDKDKRQHNQSFLSYSGKYHINEYLYAGLSGAASISAMVLPGISGSLVLILMGQYFEVVSAISALKTLNLDAVVFLTCFTIGMGLGGLFFARLIRLVLKKFYNATMAFLIGLMLGSLYALWPFKKVMVLAEHYFKQEGAIQMAENVRIYTNVNVFPQDIFQMASTLAAFVLGCWIMSVFVRHEKK